MEGKLVQQEKTQDTGVRSSTADNSHVSMDVGHTGMGQGIGNKTLCTVLLILRLLQLIFMIIAFAVMADVVGDFPDSVDAPDKWQFLLAVGVIVTFFNICWIVVLGALGRSTNPSMSGGIVAASFFYDCIFALLSFGSATGAAPSSDGASGETYDKVAASTAMMFFGSFTILWSLGYVGYVAYTKK
ncbi:hypothetical protein DUNSADRAFT_6353 [Dunaliella salina]|uniref:MARVEL domain-containing protein n=1 Tax=Dunaliella salina TaxID=3046 RepID=A0ABQ7FTE4_DUNSA|nr:hypothetical protein DUNSADRAFT_6353 [Dunaliella salina]|eukprot:KAF5836150.1 hypothetical protein DUNSADRAFT_6353 [Dunaliella salina]